VIALAVPIALVFLRLRPSTRQVSSEPAGADRITTQRRIRGAIGRPTARELFIHRSSLYNRLHRVEELSGIDMRSGADRLTLHLGLRLWRLSQPSTSVEPVRPNLRRAPTDEAADST
jgi:hypothetical protein